MNEMNQLLLKKLVLIVVLIWIAAGFAVLLIDKPLTIFIHQHGFDNWLILRNITEGVPVILLVITCGLLVIYYFARNKLLAVIAPVYFYLALKITLEVKTGLKILFGRYWPMTWINNNLSLIHDGVYGFNWLNGFGNQGSFPSGHSTYVVFCVVWLALFYPKLRPVWYLLAVCCICSLIILNYHFLGDCLAGIGLGMLMANISYRIYAWYASKSFKFNN